MRVLFVGLISGLLLGSCQTIIPVEKIQIGRLYCQERRGLYQVIVDPINGVGCHCKNGEILWLDIDEDGPFQERLDIDDGEIDTAAEREIVK